MTSSLIHLDYGTVCRLHVNPDSAPTMVFFGGIGQAGKNARQIAQRGPAHCAIVEALPYQSRRLPRSPGAITQYGIDSVLRVLAKLASDRDPLFPYREVAPSLTGSSINLIKLDTPHLNRASPLGIKQLQAVAVNLSRTREPGSV